MAINRCQIKSFEDELTGAEYSICKLSSATRTQNPIERYNELIKAGCPDKDNVCVYNLGNRVPTCVAPLSIC